MYIHTCMNTGMDGYNAWVHIHEVQNTRVHNAHTGLFHYHSRDVGMSLGIIDADEAHNVRTFQYKHVYTQTSVETRHTHT